MTCPQCRLLEGLLEHYERRHVEGVEKIKDLHKIVSSSALLTEKGHEKLRSARAKRVKAEKALRAARKEVSQAYARAAEIKRLSKLLDEAASDRDKWAAKYDDLCDKIISQGLRPKGWTP